MYNVGQTQYADIPLAKPQVHASHPYNSEKMHNKLLCYVQDRLAVGKDMRDQRLLRYAKIDRDVAGWMRMSDTDRIAERKQNQDGIPVALTMNIPLTWVHLDDMMTYFAQTFSPNRGMFYTTSKPDEVGPATQIITIMNNHSIYSGYYRQVLLCSFNTLKYNVGGYKIFWSSDMGPKLSKPAGGESASVSIDTIWSGNKVESLDMYNTFWDPSVHPTQIYKDGEWCATSFMWSHYKLQSKCAAGLYFNCEEALKNDSGMQTSVYYRDPPSEARLSNVRGNGEDWAAIFSEAPEYVQTTGFEITEVFIRLNPMQFSLLPGTPANKSTRTRFEVWRITLLNNEKLIDITCMNNIHGFLPFAFGMINDDLMGTSQKSVAEIINPLQQFASFLLNTHVRATRKNIWGLIVYDPTVVDLSKIPEGEVSARIPMEPTGVGKDVRNAIWQQDKVVDTKQTLQDFDTVMQVINQFFPTQALPSQIAGIDRAVSNQVAAVQQGTNRRNHKTARLLDDSLYRPMRFMLYYNIIQYQADGDTISDFYGKPQTIDLQALRETDLPFIIGQGLKALDRQAAADALQEIIFAIIQNPQVAQQLDLLGLIDYWTSMIDIDIDMKQFHLQQAPPGTPPGAAPVADAGVAPVSDPRAITGALQNRVGG